MGQQISILAKLKTFDWRIGVFISFLTFPNMEIYPFSRVNALKLKKLVNPDWPSGLYYKFSNTSLYGNVLDFTRNGKLPHFPSPQPLNTFSTPLIFLIEPRRTANLSFRITKKRSRRKRRWESRGWARDRDSYQCYKEG